MTNLPRGHPHPPRVHPPSLADIGHPAPMAIYGICPASVPHLWSIRRASAEHPRIICGASLEHLSPSTVHIEHTASSMAESGSTKQTNIPLSACLHACLPACLPACCASAAAFLRAVVALLRPRSYCRHSPPIPAQSASGRLSGSICQSSLLGTFNLLSIRPSTSQSAGRNGAPAAHG